MQVGIEEGCVSWSVGYFSVTKRKSRHRHYGRNIYHVNSQCSPSTRGKFLDVLQNHTLVFPVLSHLTLQQKADSEAEEEPPLTGPPPFHLLLLNSSLGTHQELPNPLILKELRPHLGSWFWILLMTGDHSLMRGCGQRGHSKVSCFAPVQVCLLGSRQGGSWTKTKVEVPV